MAKDIRSFFTVVSKTNPKVSNTSKDDSKDNIQQIKKKKRRVISSDSEDSADTFIDVKKNRKIELKETTPVNIGDIFGNAPVKRTTSKVDNKISVAKNSSKDKINKEISSTTKEKSLKSPIKKNNGNLEPHEKKSETPKKNDKNITSKKKICSDILTEKNDSITKTIQKESNGHDNNHTTHTNKSIKKHKSQEDVSIQTNSSENSSDSKKKSTPSKNKTSNKVAEVVQNINTSSKLKTTDETLESSNGTLCNQADSSDKINSPGKNRKRKLTEEITDEERYERKRMSAALYKTYLNRSGPKHHGSKKVPEGAPGCLKGYAFLVTGVLDSFERDEISDIVQRFGGEMKQSLSSKVTHMICGEEAGPAKIAKAEKLQVSIINEDDFLNLIKNKSSNTSPKKEIQSKCKKDSTPNKKKKCTDTDQKILTNKKDFSKSKSPNKANLLATKTKVEISNESEETKPVPSTSSLKVKEECTKSSTETHPSILPYNLTLTEKYRPKTMKQIIGQQGESSCAQKLYTWLSKWYQRRQTKQPAPNPWSKGDGAYYKAILLNGPPGVGKTTTASVVAKELGFDIVEFNASDTRSKNLIKEQMSELVSTNSLFGFFNGKKSVSKKHVIIMDEVDGMGGNEDRGGMQELLSLIKHTSVPIICICNDKTSPKMRSLTNNCYDITFNRPKVEQIKGAVRSICFKEGMKIPQNTLEEIINASSQDMRQILNTISLWYTTHKTTSNEEVKENEIKISKKDIKIGPWSVIKSVFSEEDHKKMTTRDKSDLFFNDYSMIPLFVQHNYLKVIPHCPKKEVLHRFAEAADSLSLGDLVDSKIRSMMAWNLLPLQAMFCCVMPGTLLSGHIQGAIDFPGWLGQNSKTNKMNRIVQELHSHTRLSTSGSKRSIRLDYASSICNAIVNPLINNKADGIEESVKTMQMYHLLREDLDSLMEFTTWTGKSSKMSLIDSKIKTAFTKNFNKESVPLPYSQSNIKKSQYTSSADDIDFDEVEKDGNSDNDDKLENDAMIKKTKKVNPSKDKMKKESKQTKEKDTKPSKKVPKTKK